MPDLRPLTPSDAPSLAEIHAASFGDEAWSADSLRSSLSLETTHGWAATVDRAIAGFILCQMTLEVMEVLTFCVRPTYRKQGIGKALLNHALANRPKGSAALLEVAADNQEAERLYLSCGFIRSGVRIGYYRKGETSVDAVIYRTESE